MTSPNFLSHIGHSGFVQQPGIGDILGQQFQNLAQTRGVVREQDQRQQQIDQLGQYYQGQVNEMQRLRDQQEMAAQAEAQQQARLAAHRAQLDRLYPIPQGADEKTAWEIQTKRLLAMAQYGDPMAGPLSNILNAMRPKDEGKPFERDLNKELRSPDGKTVLAPAAPPPAGKKVERTVDLGNKQHVWYTDGSEADLPKGAAPRAPGSGDGISPYQGVQIENQLGDDFRAETKEIDKALLNNRKIDAKVVEEAATKNSLPAQYQVMVSFIQALDNSVVREGEVALYRSSEPLLQRANNFLAKYAEGKAQLVNPASIRQMAQLTKRAQEKLIGARTKIRNHYINRGRRAGLEKPEDLFRDDDGADGDDALANEVDKLLNPSKP